MLSGDEYLINGDALRAHLEKHRGEVDGKSHDLHFIKVIVDTVTSYQPRVFRTGSGWRYEGVVHETPHNRVNPDAPVAVVDSAGIDHVVFDHERRFSNIWEVHVPLLQKELAKNPNDSRSLVFLAQSYECLLAQGGFDEQEKQQYSREAFGLYIQRLALPFETDLERNYCFLHMLTIAHAASLMPDAILYSHAETLAEKDPYRPEVALLRAELAQTLLPLMKVYKLYAHAAEVAKIARGIVNTSPVDLSCEWRAHRFSAVCARQLAKKYPEYSALVQDHVTAGIAAGGAPETFLSLTEDV